MPKIALRLSYNKYDKTVPIKIKLEAQIVKTETCWTYVCGAYGGLDKRPIIRWRGRQRHVAIVMWELEHGERVPKGMYICHHCDNPQCVRPSHLFVGTPKQNMEDCKAKGRLGNSDSKKHLGEDNGGGGKMTNEKVSQLREDFERIGRKRGTRNIALERNWKHV